MVGMRKFTPLALLVAFAVPAWAQSPNTIIETIVARINSEIITLGELSKQRETLREEVKQRFTGIAFTTEFSTREKDLLRDLIDNSLLIQKGKEEGINAEAETIKELDRIRKSLNLPDMEALEKAVTQAGQNFEDYKSSIKNQIITRQVVNREVGSRLQVTKEDVAKFYEEHKKEMDHPEQVYLREILVSTEGLKDEALAVAEKKANDLVARARKGEDFSALASKESDDSSAQKGGDLGQYWKRGVLAKEIEDPVFKAKKGDILDPIRTKTGFLILNVAEHQQAGTPALADVEQQINEHLYVEKMQPALREYLTKLRDEAYLEVRAGYTDSGATGTLSSAHLIPVDAPVDDLTTTVAKAKKANARKIYKPWTLIHK